MFSSLGFHFFFLPYSISILCGLHKVNTYEPTHTHTPKIWQDHLLVYFYSSNRRWHSKAFIYAHIITHKRRKNTLRAHFGRLLETISIAIYFFLSFLFFSRCVVISICNAAIFQGWHTCKEEEEKKKNEKIWWNQGHYIYSLLAKKKQFFNVISSMFPYNFVAFLFSMAAFCRHRVKIATEIWFLVTRFYIVISAINQETCNTEQEFYFFD